MKVYIVMYTDWEDGQVVSVWSTQARAEEEAARKHAEYKTDVPTCDHSHYHVEEHEVQT